MPLMHPERRHVDDIELEAQIESFGLGRETDRIVTRLVANADADLDGLDIERSGLAREFPNRVEGQDDVDGAAPDGQLDVHAFEAKFLGGREDGIFDDEPGRSGNLYGGGNHTFGHRFTVDVDAVAELDAYDQFAQDPLPDRALPAVNERRDPDILVASPGAGCFVVYDDPTERGVDQRLRAVALLVGVVEELRDDDAVFVGDEDAGIRNPFEERVLAPDLVVQDPVAANDLAIDIRKQAKRDVLFLAELGQGLLIVVRDRVELDARRPKLVESVAQLTELRPTRRSPDGRSVEDDR
jgi:hypothetical protein